MKVGSFWSIKAKVIRFAIQLTIKLITCHMVPDNGVSPDPIIGRELMCSPYVGLYNEDPLTTCD